MLDADSKSKRGRPHREDDLAVLQARLAALKSESQGLDADIASSAAANNCGQLKADEEGAESRGYSSIGAPALPPRQRASVIRRAGAAGAVFLCVVLVCTLVSQPFAGRDGLLGVQGRQGPASLASLPQALKAVGPELTVGERKLFANDATRLAEDEARHERLERERAGHLLKLIMSTVDHNEKHEVMQKHIMEQVQAHREALAMLKQERRSMIRGTDGVEGHPQTDSRAVGGVQLPQKGLTGEIDEAFHQQLIDEHARDAESREQRESRFMREREAAGLARQSKERAVDDAREKYHNSREYVVKAKDALKDALAERDQKTEEVRREGFISEKEALTQLEPIQGKVKRLVQEVVVAKSQWEAAHSVLENAESIGTRPELSFPAPFTHHPVQQLALSRKSPAHHESAGFLHARAAAAHSAAADTSFLPASAAAASASAAADAEQVSTLANANAQQQHAMTVGATSTTSTQPHLLGGAQAMVAAARHRLAVKAAGGLTGGLARKDFKTVKGPRTYDGEDNVVAMPAGVPSMFSGASGAPEEVLASKPH